MRNRLASFFAALPQVSLVLVVASLAGMGCKDPTVIGTACKSDGDCNIAGQVCAPGFDGGPKICTRKCVQSTGATGCPIGYDCFPTDATKGNTCNKVKYDIDAAGNPLLFGVDCSLDEGKCAALGSTNASPTCRKISDGQDPPMPVANDPNAYCSGACNTDGDCPLLFRCAMDYDGAKKCIKRRGCSECVVDENCPDKQCIATADGSARYCTKTCNSANDCGGVQNTALGCYLATNTAGVEVTACVHRYGSCVGAGNICDPCRRNEDCTAPDTFCVTNSASGEAFCSKSCNSNSDCEGGSVPAECDNADPNYSYQICHAKDGAVGQLSCYAYREQ